jgi:hypothetical protein
MTGDWQVPRNYSQGGEAYQWGLAAPAGYEPVYLVPRPPRPGVVNIAVVLTYIGVAVSGIGFLVSLLASLQAQRMISQLPTGRQASPPVLQTSIGLSIGIGALAWLVPAAGAVVCAVLTRRGANPARIVLASLMGLFALVNLCYGVLRGISAGVGSSVPGLYTGVAQGFNWAGLAVDVVDLALAVTIGVLLLVPAANRYFSPGPGRRFVNGTGQVPSTYDRP